MSSMASEQQQHSCSSTSDLSTNSSGAGDETCWVCLCGGEDEPLERPCECVNRPVHAKCLARWQLQSAGRDEERKCRFCQAELPDWRPTLTPSHLINAAATPVVSVHYNGTCYRIKVKPGANGLAQFQRQLHKITGMPMLECMNVTFCCRSPDNAQELNFKGISAFDAAIHCASVSAAERQAQRAASATLATAGTGRGAASRRSADFPHPSTTTTSSGHLAPGSSSAVREARRRALAALHRGASLDSARPPLVYGSARHPSGGAGADLGLGGHAGPRLEEDASERGEGEGEEDYEVECEEVEGVRGVKAGPMERVRSMFRRLLALAS